MPRRSLKLKIIYKYKDPKLPIMGFLGQWKETKTPEGRSTGRHKKMHERKAFDEASSKQIVVM